MSSASKARQNRRKRLGQHPVVLPKILSNSENETSIPESDELKSEHLNQDSKSYSTETNVGAETCNPSNTAERQSYETLSFTTDCTYINGDISSRPVEKIYIEGERGFKEINASQIFHLTHAEISIQSDYKNELIYQASVISKYFHKLSNFCHGLLGGISLLYLFVLLHLFSDLSLDEEVIRYFSFFSKPIHNIFNFLCIICCISIFDRFDIINTEEFFKLIRKLDFKLITLLVYPIALLLSFSTANVDDKLSMLKKNGTVWKSSNFAGESELYYWKTLSISKCFGALLGWMVICWDQNFNLFLNYLRNMQHRTKILH